MFWSNFKIIVFLWYTSEMWLTRSCLLYGFFHSYLVTTCKCTLIEFDRKKKDKLCHLSLPSFGRHSSRLNLIWPQVLWEYEIGVNQQITYSVCVCVCSLYVVLSLSYIQIKILLYVKTSFIWKAKIEEREKSSATILSSNEGNG